MNPFNFLSMPDYTDPMKVNGPFTTLQQPNPMPQNQPMPYIPPPQMQMPPMGPLAMLDMPGQAKQPGKDFVKAGVETGAKAMGIPEPIAKLLGNKASGRGIQYDQAPQLGPLPQFQQMANGSDQALQMFRGLLG